MATKFKPPHNFREALQQTSKDSLKVSWFIIKVYIPLSILTAILKQAGILDFIAPFFSPLMHLMGLPGESAIVLITGFLNLFGGLGSLAALNLTVREVTILGVILGISHGLIIETGILMKIKMATARIAFFRAIVAVFTGIILNLIMPQNIKGVVLNPYVALQFSWINFIKSLLLTSVQLIIIMFLISIFYELFMLWKYSKTLKTKIRFVPKIFGFSESALGPWIIGLFIGITYGAGILFQFARKHKLSHKDVCLTTVFLCLSHAVIEDTMLFVVLGGNFWWLLVPRIIMAFIIVRILAINNLYKKFLWIGLPKEKIK